MITWETRSIHKKDVSRLVIKATAHSWSGCRDRSSRREREKCKSDFNHSAMRH